MTETRKYIIDDADGCGKATGELTIEGTTARGEWYFVLKFDHEYWTGGDWAQYRHTEIVEGGTMVEARAHAEEWLSAWGDVRLHAPSPARWDPPGRFSVRYQ